MNSTSFSQNILILALDSTSGAVRDFHRTLLTTTSRVYKGCRIWLLDTRVCKFVAREFPSLSPPVKAYSASLPALLQNCEFVGTSIDSLRIHLTNNVPCISQALIWCLCNLICPIFAPPTWAPG